MIKQQNKQWRNNDSHSSIRRMVLQILCIFFYLISWVANSELLQGITNGSLCPDHVPYDKPAFLSYFSYNYMMISWVFVYPYAKFRRRCSLPYYLTVIWPGRIGFRKAVLACAFISYLLLALNILYIVGLHRISVGMSNAIFQLQTPFTMGLSVLLLNDKLVASEGLGVIVSLIGVCFILMPLFSKESETEEPSNVGDWSLMIGVGSTLLSAAIGAIYLVFWRVLSETKNLVPLDGFEGLIDTFTTVAMIGATNMLFGWPFLLFVHWIGWESLSFPPLSHWRIINTNAFVEYLFDTSCAITIYMTSAIVTTVTAPLTIPLAMVTDRILYRELSFHNSLGQGFIGTALVVVGIILLEMKPGLSYCRRKGFVGKKKDKGIECV